MLGLSRKYFSRYRDIVWLLYKYGRADLVEQSGLGGLLADEDVEPEVDGGAPTPGELAADLERLGPTYVKLGQLLSTRPDLLPQPYLDALTRLQDNAQPAEPDTIAEVFVEEFGVPAEKLFLQFDSEPLASASIGQVHRALLVDGRPVAVKVQRPGVRRRIADDLAALGSLASLLEAHTDFGERYQVHALVETLRHSLMRELDYRAEAANAKLLAENLKKYPRLHVVRPLAEFSTGRVLTMEFVDGLKVTDLDAETMEQLDGPGLADELFRAVLQQVLIDGAFHADPHPGNMLITREGHVALLDVGMVAHVSPEMRSGLVKLLLAISEGRGEEAARLTLRLGQPGKRCDEASFQRRITELVSEHRHTPIERLNAGRIVMDIQNAAGAAQLYLPGEFTMFGKMLMNLDEVVRALDPCFEPNEAIHRHAASIMRSHTSDRFSLASFYGAMIEATELMTALPERLNKMTRLMSENRFKIQVEAIDEDQLLRGVHRVANRISMGLIIASLVIGASLMMRIDNTWVRVMAAVFFLMAGCCGLYMVARTLFSDESDSM